MLLTNDEQCSYANIPVNIAVLLLGLITVLVIIWSVMEVIINGCHGTNTGLSFVFVFL